MNADLAAEASAWKLGQLQIAAVCQLLHVVRKQWNRRVKIDNEPRNRWRRLLRVRASRADHRATKEETRQTPHVRLNCTA